MRGSAGGLEKLSAGVSGLVKKRLDCTVETLNTELKVKTCIFTCRFSSNMGRLIEVYFRSWCHYELRDMLLICLV